jgi:tetratricopeptide (TPR) repeat protein
MNAGWKHALVCFVLAGLTLASMGRVVGHDFINLDDAAYISLNPEVYQGLTWSTVAWAWTTFHGALWMPITWLSFQLDATLFWPSSVQGGTEEATQAAWGFHLTNLVLHLANVLLLYAVLVRYTHFPTRSALVAAFFAVHPLHVESVAWITERKDVLSAFFLLLTLLSYHHYVRKGSRGAYVLVFLFFFLGLASKAMLVTLPCVLLLLDYWPLGRLRWGQKVPESSVEVPKITLRWAIMEKVPLFFLSLGMAILTFYIHYQQGAIYLSLPLENRLANAFYAFGFYLEKTFWPINLGLTYPVQQIPLLSGQALIPLGIVALITAVACLRARRQPALIVGWLWFLGTLVPVSGLVGAGSEVVADRFVYIPHMGLLVMIVWWVGDILTSWRLPELCQQALGWSAVGLAAYLTFFQVGHWKDTVTIMSHSIQVSPNNAKAMEYLGNFLFARGQAEELRGQAVEARRHYEGARHMIFQAVNLKESFQNNLLLANVHAKLGNLDDKTFYMQRAARIYEKQLEHERGTAEGHLQLGQALYYSGEVPAAIKHLNISLQIAESPAAHFLLGLIHLGQGDNDQALGHFQRTLDFSPRADPAWDRKGIALGRKNLWSEALKCFEQATQLRPDGLYYRANLAFAYWNLERREEAHKEYQKILAKAPDWPSRASARAVSLATHPNPGLRDLGEALELAQQACQADQFQNADLLKNQALVFAAAGVAPR